MLASQEIYYIDREMSEAQDALICIKDKILIEDKNRERLSDLHYFRPTEELTNLYKDIPEALENNYNFPLRFSFRPKKKYSYFA